MKLPCATHRGRSTLSPDQPVGNQQQKFSVERTFLEISLNPKDLRKMSVPAQYHTSKGLAFELTSKIVDEIAVEAPRRLQHWGLQNQNVRGLRASGSFLERHCYICELFRHDLYTFRKSPIFRTPGGFCRVGPGREPGLCPDQVLCERDGGIRTGTSAEAASHVRNYAEGQRDNKGN